MSVNYHVPLYYPLGACLVGIYIYTTESSRAYERKRERKSAPEVTGDPLGVSGTLSLQEAVSQRLPPGFQPGFHRMLAVMAMMAIDKRSPLSRSVSYDNPRHEPKTLVRLKVARPAWWAKSMVYFTCKGMEGDADQPDAHVPATNPAHALTREGAEGIPLVHHHFLVLSDGYDKLNHQLQAAPNRKLFRGQKQSPNAIFRRTVAA